jgi:hypothetical protein
VSLAIRRITIAVLAAFLAGAVLAVPASSMSGPAAVAKKKPKKCKKGKKGKKKRKGCKRGNSSRGGGIPGQATPLKPKAPNQPTGPANPALNVASIEVAANPLLAGNSTTGQVTVDDAAPSGGQQVDLSSNSARVSMPASVVVAPNQTSASFPVDTTSGAPVTATLMASVGNSSATTQLSLVDKPSVESVELERQCFTVDAWPNNLVTLDIPAPSDTVVSLSSSNPLSLAPATPTVTVPSGETSALFTVDALLPSLQVTIEAAAPSTPAQSDSASVDLTDPATEAEGLSLDPATVKPGDVSIGTVTLTCEAPPGGTEVTLTSSDPSRIVVAPTVTVPAGELSVGFPITIQPGTPDGQYQISANTPGDDPIHQTLTIDSVLAT